MSRVITFSKYFPAYHPRIGEPTLFVEQIQGGLKVHTIRAGNRWKVGDKFSPRIWAGKPYRTPQLTIAPDMEIKKVWDYEVKINPSGVEQWFINGTMVSESNDYMQQWFNAGLIELIARNDGLTLQDFLNWFKHPSNFKGQIICWNENINY